MEEHTEDARAAEENARIPVPYFMPVAPDADC